MSGFYSHNQKKDSILGESKDEIHRYGIYFFCVLGLGYVVSTIYFLFHGDYSAVRSSCGGMWEVLMLRIICSLLLSFLILLYFFEEYSFLKFLDKGTGTWFFLMYFLIFSIVQLYFYSTVLVDSDDKNPRSCINTIKRESPGNTSALIIISWFSFSLDIVFFLLYVYKIFMTTCIKNKT
jgi:hypothetical protein